MKILMSRKIVPIQQSIYLVIGISLGVLALLSVNSLFINYKTGLELTLLGSVPNVRVQLKNSDSNMIEKITNDLNLDENVVLINEVLMLSGKIRAYSLKRGDGVFGNKKDIEFIMYGIRIYDIGYYINLLKNSYSQKNHYTDNLHKTIQKGLSAYKKKLIEIEYEENLHNKLCAPPLSGRNYTIKDIDNLLSRKNYDEQDLKLLTSIERCISACVNTKFAFDIEEIIYSKTDLYSIAYSDKRILINDGFCKSILTQPAGKLRFEINSIDSIIKNIKIPEKIFFTTGGVFKQGLLGGDKATIIISMDKMASIFNLDSKPNEIFIKLKDPYKSKQYADYLKKKWGNKIDVIDWISANNTTFLFITFLKVLLFIILFMIILVSAFGISAQLFITVFEKEKHIAVLKAIGATSTDIVLIFITYSLYIGFSGVLFGVIGGYIVSYYSTMLQGEWIQDLLNSEKILINISMNDIIFIFLSVLLLCIFAAIIPAKKAAKTDPIIGLNVT